MRGDQQPDCAAQLRVPPHLRRIVQPRRTLWKAAHAPALSATQAWPLKTPAQGHGAASQRRRATVFARCTDAREGAEAPDPLGARDELLAARLPPHWDCAVPG